MMEHHIVFTGSAMPSNGGSESSVPKMIPKWVLVVSGFPVIREGDIQKLSTGRAIFKVYIPVISGIFSCKSLISPEWLIFDHMILDLNYCVMSENWLVVC
jgi:hypothetical protein